MLDICDPLKSCRPEYVSIMPIDKSDEMINWSSLYIQFYLPMVAIDIRHRVPKLTLLPTFL